MIAEIGVPLPVKGLYYYRIPEDKEERVKPGMRVYVEYGKRHITGIVFSLKDRCPEGVSLKDIEEIIDEEPPFSEKLLKLALWVSEYYCAPLGEVTKILLSPGYFLQSRKFVLRGEYFERFYPEDEAGRLLKNSLLKRGRITLRMAREKCGASTGYLNKLVEKGYVRIEEKKIKKGLKDFFGEIYEVEGSGLDSIHLSPFEKDLYEYIKAKGFVLPSQLKGIFGKKVISCLQSLVDKGFLRRKDLSTCVQELPAVQAPVFTDDQKRIIDSITHFIEKGDFKTCVIHGVTGSGKTELYIELAKRTLKKGKSVLILFPEIILAGHLITRISYHLGRVAVLHSGLKFSERAEFFEGIIKGNYRVVVGVRSAVFAPLKNPGLIVVDEEHEGTYKQEEGVKYNARDVAVMRGYMENAVVILGSATISLETYYNSLKGKYLYFYLPKKVLSSRNPEVKIVPPPHGGRVFSDELLKEIEEALSKKTQVLLLAHRRGYSPLRFCLSCRRVRKCENCDVSLTYHKNKNILICHYCGYSVPAVSECPYCSAKNYYFAGYGTERVEEEFRKFFPHESVARLDSDTASRREYVEKTLAKFEKGEIHVLIGTQMIAKGLDIPNLSLTGVVSADTLFNLPDMRAEERAFQLLVQVAGRSGRRENVVGKIIIQTRFPESDIIKYIVEGNLMEFYKRELDRRKELLYPPVSRMILITLEGKNENLTREIGEELRNDLERIAKGEEIKILGPAPAPFFYMREKYRFQIIIKNAKGTRFFRYLNHPIIIKYFEKVREIKISVNVDPVSAL